LSAESTCDVLYNTVINPQLKGTEGYIGVAWISIKGGLTSSNIAASSSNSESNFVSKQDVTIVLIE
jgi:hypothetical protein